LNYYRKNYLYYLNYNSPKYEIYNEFGYFETIKNNLFDRISQYLLPICGKIYCNKRFNYLSNANKEQCQLIK
jgi:hypothetical protein